LATNFPASTDDGTTLPNPSGSSTQNSPDHAGLHSNENDAIRALETKLGTGTSTPSLNTLLIGTGSGTSAFSKASPNGGIVGTTDAQTLTNKILTSPTINGGTFTNATITSDSITGFTTAGSGSIYGIAIAAGAITTANSISSTAIATNAVQANQLSTSAIKLGYAQIVTPFNTTSTSAVQVTGLTATVTVPAGGRSLEITAFCGDFTSSVSAYTVLTIWDGTVGTGTQISRSQIGPTSTQQSPGIAMAIVSPTAGTKTYNVGFQTSAGSASLDAGATYPAFILVKAL
jgi:hypothetical protein